MKIFSFMYKISNVVKLKILELLMDRIFIQLKLNMKTETCTKMSINGSLNRCIP